MGNSSHKDLSDAMFELESGISKSTRQLMKAELSNETQVFIVKELLLGERTLTELVQLIYSLRYDDPGFSTSYSKVRRELQALESRGFVSRRLIGGDRPYRLTQLAVVRITRIASTDSNWSPSIIPPVDIVLYTVTVFLITICGLSSRGFLVFPLNSSFLVMFSVSLVFGGMSLIRFIETVLRVA